jgi:hypothetical protein
MWAFFHINLFPGFGQGARVREVLLGMVRDKKYGISSSSN